MNNITELVIIIDQSGSMQGLQSDVIGGYNALIEEQKKEGETLVTTIFFSSVATYVHERVDIKTLNPITQKDYRPGGCTALLDAVGDAIAFIKAKHASLSEEALPAHTIFSIMTDGYENASREYTYERVHSMIEMQQKCGWTFLFQAANIDVAKEAHSLGIHPAMAFCFVADPEGVGRGMKKACGCISEARQKPRRK